MRRLCALLIPLVFAAACSAPPHKELDRAEGAIDTARAAGAEQYAPAAFTAATNAMKDANDAVTQRDYRLALTRALDAYARAQEAARGAADGKAKARSDAEAAITTAAAALTKLEARLFAVTPRMTKRDADAARAAHTDVEAALQEARATLSTGAFLDAGKAARAATTRIEAQLKALDEVPAAKPAKPVRRRR